MNDPVDSGEAAATLAKALLQEDDQAVRRATLARIPRAWVQAVVLGLARAEVKRAIEILSLLAEKFHPLSWVELEALSERTEPPVLAMMLRVLVPPLADDAIAWAGRAYRASFAPGAMASHDLRWRSYAALRRSLSIANVGFLDAETRAILGRDLEGEARELSRTVDEDLDEQDELAEDHGFYDDFDVEAELIAKELAAVGRLIELLGGIS